MFILRNKILIENLSSMISMQLANYVLPLVALSYLLRVLGPEKAGAIFFAESVIYYFSTLTNYGFELSATREISLHRDDKVRVSKIVSSVFLIKILLTLIGFAIFFNLILWVPKFRSEMWLFLFTFGLVGGSALNPAWLFQGMEKMKFIPVLGITTQMISLSGILLFIQHKEDYMLVPIINAGVLICVSIAGSLFALRYFKLHLTRPDFSDIKHYLCEGWHLFLSTVSVSLYTTSNIFILGLFTNHTIVGYYAAAEKLIKAVLNLLFAVSQALYPHINQLVRKSQEEGLLFIKHAIKWIAALAFLTSVLIFILARPVVYLVFGSGYENSVAVLKILAILPFIVSLNNILGMQTLISFGYKKIYSSVLVMAGLINVIMAVIWAPLFQHIGMAMAVLVTETFVTVMFIYFLHNRNIITFRQFLQLPFLRRADGMSRL